MKYQSELSAALTSYIFIVLPFIVLILIKLLLGRAEDILLTGDWSIASAMIYSSSIISIKNALNSSNKKVNNHSFDLFIAITICMACISIAIYVVALINPSFTVGVIQIGIFIAASITHIRNSRVVYRLNNNC